MNSTSQKRQSKIVDFLMRNPVLSVTSSLRGTRQNYSISKNVYLQKEQVQPLKKNPFQKLPNFELPIIHSYSDENFLLMFPVFQELTLIHPYI